MRLFDSVVWTTWLIGVDFRERHRQRVLRLQKPVLDDEEIAVGVDDVTDLVVVDRPYVVSLHAPLPPFPRGVLLGNTERVTRVRGKASALLGSRLE